MKKWIALALTLLLIPGVASPTIISRTTYSAGTVIDPTAVNANENAVVNDYNGSIDNTNIKANGVAFSNLAAAIQQFWSYRRPVLQYTSATTVTVESGINGTSGQALIVFPDGSFRTDSTATHLILDISRVASLSGTKQSGLRTGSVANNTWYAVYAVKASDNSTDFVAVADTTLPTQANYSTLNTAFATQGWVYLGLIRYGDQGSNPTGILQFTQSGHVTIFRNAGAGANAINCNGVLLATSAGTSSLAWTATPGTSGVLYPNNTGPFYLTTATGGASTKNQLTQNGVTIHSVANNSAVKSWVGTNSLTCDTGNAAGTADIWLSGFMDGALGIGSNPLL